jgi:Predicted transcriptional regulators
MGVLEILAERSLGAKALKRHAKLMPRLSQLDRTGLDKNKEADEFQKERIVSIVRLLTEYGREEDPEEKENILRSLEEIVLNAPLKLASQSIEAWEANLNTTDKEYAAAHARAEKKEKAFLAKYFSFRANAGLATQAAVATKAGLSRSYVAVIETGKHFPQQKTLQKLAKAFEVDVSDLA